LQITAFSVSNLDIDDQKVGIETIFLSILCSTEKEEKINALGNANGRKLVSETNSG